MIPVPTMPNHRRFSGINNVEMYYLDSGKWHPIELLNGPRLESCVSVARCAFEDEYEVLLKDPAWMADAADCRQERLKDAKRAWKQYGEARK